VHRVAQDHGAGSLERAHSASSEKKAIHRVALPPSTVKTQLPAKAQRTPAIGAAAPIAH
jgi:hypothetical protein